MSGLNAWHNLKFRMAAISDTDTGLLGGAFEPQNTFLTSAADTAHRDKVMEEREFFMNNLRRELKPEGPPLDFDVDVVGAGLDIGCDEGTPLADLEVTPLNSGIQTEVINDKNNVSRITIRDSTDTTTVVIFTLRRTVMVSINNTVLPWAEMLAASYIHLGNFGEVVAESDKRSYVFKNTTVQHMIEALIAIDNEVAHV